LVPNIFCILDQDLESTKEEMYENIKSS